MRLAAALLCLAALSLAALSLGALSLGALNRGALNLGARASEAFVTNQLGDDVSVLDLAGGKITATIPVGGKPAGIAMARDTTLRAAVSMTETYLPSGLVT